MLPLEKPFFSWASFTGSFTADELDRIIAFKNVISPVPGRIMNKLSGIRESQLYWLTLDDATRWVFERLAAVISDMNQRGFYLNLTETESLQLTEYSEDVAGHYGVHCDMGYGQEITRRRKLSLTLQLTEPDQYDGGDLLLYPNDFTPVKAPRERGSAILFRSYILHEVTPVTRGVRYSLVTWIDGPELV